MLYLWRDKVDKSALGRQEENMAIARRSQEAILSKEDAGIKIMRHANLLSGQLQQLRTRMYAPTSEKVLRPFLTNEVSKLTSIPDLTLKHWSSEGRGPEPGRLENNHRVYTLAQINELRALFAAQKPSDALKYLPHRRPGEHLQVLSIANFKGGSAKTTTCVHLAHYLALQGYRVLALDLDPQASLSAMFGSQPEFDVGPNETIYAALRYEESEKRPIRDVIRKTYFEGIDIVPGNLEVMEYEHETPRILANKTGSGAIFFERLKLCLAEVEDDYDIVILDTPPSLGFLTLSAIYAATSMIITVHPAMLDVASMSQFLLMMGDLIGVLNESGAQLDQDFIRYLITRHDPNDAPQSQVVAMMRHLFGADVLLPTSIESTAVEAAGLAKRSIYELEVGQIGRDTHKRAREAVDAVNASIVRLINDSWGRE